MNYYLGLYVEVGLVEMPSGVARELSIRLRNHLVLLGCDYEPKKKKSKVRLISE